MKPTGTDYTKSEFLTSGILIYYVCFFYFIHPYIYLFFTGACLKLAHTSQNSLHQVVRQSCTIPGHSYCLVMWNEVFCQSNYFLIFDRPISFSDGHYVYKPNLSLFISVHMCSVYENWRKNPCWVSKWSKYPLCIKVLAVCFNRILKG